MAISAERVRCIKPGIFKCTFLAALFLNGTVAAVAQSHSGESRGTTLSLVPRGSEQPSFNCEKAKTAAARLICADGELARLDGELGEAFRKQKALIPAADQSKFVASQIAWIRKRNESCALKGKDAADIQVLADLKPCIASALRERIDILKSDDSLVPQPARQVSNTPPDPNPSPERAASASPRTYKPNWKRIEADNGAVVAIDLASIFHNDNGSAEAMVCVVDNDACSPLDMSRFLFDCHGHYSDSNRLGGNMLAPPRSVVGQMANLACAGAKDTRFADDSDNPRDRPKPSPSEYCFQLSPDACDRVRAVVESYNPLQALPPQCKAGYGLAERGLTQEQRNTCSAITGIKTNALHTRRPALVAASTDAVTAKPGEIVVGRWSGKGKGKSTQFRIERGPWEFRVWSSDSIDGGVYKVEDQTSVYTFGYPDEGKQDFQLKTTGDLYFVVESWGNWTVTVVTRASAGN